MPYYVHDPNVEPLDGQMFESKDDAVAARQGTQQLSYVVNEDERYVWQRRERLRLQEGQYRRLPFVTIYKHYAHYSTKQPMKLAYTPNDQYGHEDRQMVTTPGRYLEEFSERLGYSADDWPQLIGLFKAGLGTLKFTADPDEIVRVYCAPGGPNSCMDGHHDFDWDKHPVRAYGGTSDLSLAYIGELHPTNKELDQISARAVVWMEQKAWVRIYGDISYMESMLQAEGFTRRDGWYGAKLRVVSDGHRGYLMPYIDGDAQHADLSRGFFHLSDSGDYNCATTTGTTRPTSTCENCGEECDPDEAYCEHCRDQRWSCVECGDSYWDGDDSYSSWDGSLCESCYEAHTRTCEVCEDTWNDVELRPRMRHEGDLCCGCEETHSMCDHCNDWTHIDQLQDAAGDRVCADCLADYHRELRLQREKARLAKRGRTLYASSAGYVWASPLLIPLFDMSTPANVSDNHA